VGFQDPQQKGSFQRAEKSISSEETGLGDRAEMLEHLPGKRKPLSSNLKYFHKKEKKRKKKKLGAGGWLTHAILATQEAEKRKIVVPTQARANSSQDSISKIPITKRGRRSGSGGTAPA
jgi:hypothetical protein